MAGIKVEDGKFEVSFESLDGDGKKAPFRSFYTALGEPIALRQPDPRSSAERWGGLPEDYPHSSVRQGIYQSHSTGGYLVFIDKLESEEEVFVNWRAGFDASYRRAAIGRPTFHAYTPKPRPNISKLQFQNGRFFLAWIRDSQPDAQLVLSSINLDSATRRNTIIAPKMGLVTLISMEHIETFGLIVCHRAIVGGEDAKIDVFPVTLQSDA